jgi:lipopolysaccharide assembly outer membrane protein LptD (OstA)
VEFDQARDVYLARGNVHIERGGKTLDADWVAFNNTTRHGLASGNVKVVDEEDTLYSDFLQFNVQTLQGVVFEGSLENPITGFRMEGEELRKTEEKTYVFKDALFTTCRCPEESRDPWRIRADHAKLEVDGYATARNTTFDILGVPVIWLPWFIYPIKTDRASGFLFPRFSVNSRSGTMIGLPYFWAAHDQVNVLVTPTWTADRGPLLRFNTSYVIGDETRRDHGDLNLVYVPSDDEVEPNYPYDEERWGFTFEHLQELNDRLSLRAFVNAISDNEVPFDLEEVTEYRRDRYLPSVVSLTDRLDRYGPFGAYAAVRWADDLQAPDDMDRDEFVLQRLPEVHFSQAAAPLPFLSRVITSFDVDYTHFWNQNDAIDERRTATVVDDLFLDTGIDALPDGYERNDNGQLVTLDGRIISRDGTVITAAEVTAGADPMADPDQLALQLADTFNPDQSGDNASLGLGGAEGDGVFQEGEPVADRGHRLLVNPRVGVPFRIGDALELYPELGYHGTFYQTHLQSFSDRQLATGRVDLRSRLRKTLDFPFEMGQMYHLMEPRLSYYAIADIGDDERNPLFIPGTAVPQERIRQLELDAVLRDPADRIRHRHGVTAAVANRFYTIELEPEAPVEGEVTTAAPVAADRSAGDAFAPRSEEDEDEEPDLWVPNRIFADITTGFEYRFTNSEFGWFVADGRVFPTAGTRVRLKFGYDLEETDVAEGMLEFGWSSPQGHDLRVRYRYLRQIPLFFEDFSDDDERFDEFDPDEQFESINQIDIGARWAITRSWALLYDLRYSFEDAVTLTNRGGIEYISKCKCWAARVTLEEDRSRGVEFGFQYVILGLGDDTVRPFSGGVFGAGLGSGGNPLGY